MAFIFMAYIVIAYIVTAQLLKRVWTHVKNTCASTSVLVCAHMSIHMHKHTPDLHVGRWRRRWALEEDLIEYLYLWPI